MLRVMCLAYGAFVVAWNVMRFTALAAWPPFELADLWGFLLYAPAPVFVLVALALRSRTAITGIVLALVPFAIEYGPLFTPSDAADGTPIRVLTANLLLDNEQWDGVARVVRSTDADVVVLHELSEAMSEQLTERLAQTHPHRAMYPRASALGMGVLSRLPITQQVAPRLGRRECSCMEVRVRVGGREVTVVAAHALGPHLGRSMFDTRTQQHTMDDLLARVRSRPRPLVLAGDLNVGDRHRFYRQLRKVLGDAHRDAGWGLGFTFEDARPILRIDYVLRSEELATARSYAGTLPGSDHRYVFADLRVKRG